MNQPRGTDITEHIKGWHHTHKAATIHDHLVIDHAYPESMISPTGTKKSYLRAEHSRLHGRPIPRQHVVLGIILIAMAGALGALAPGFALTLFILGFSWLIVRHLIARPIDHPYSTRPAAIPPPTIPE